MTRRRLVSAGITTQTRPPKVIRDWFAGGPETIAAYIYPEHEHVRGWWLDYCRDNPNAKTPIGGAWLSLGDR
jgi:hypothetical protein